LRGAADRPVLEPEEDLRADAERFATAFFAPREDAERPAFLAERPADPRLDAPRFAPPARFIERFDPPPDFRLELLFLAAMSNYS
jgi:hypothetical protein